MKEAKTSSKRKPETKSVAKSAPAKSAKSDEVASATRENKSTPKKVPAPKKSIANKSEEPITVEDLIFGLRIIICEPPAKEQGSIFQVT